MRKKWILGLLLTSIVFGLTGCGKEKKEEQKTETESAAAAASEDDTGIATDSVTESVTESTSDTGTEGAKENASTETTEISTTSENDFHDYVQDEEEQLELIMNNIPTWHDEEYSEEGPRYAVTDLDHNGRLELIMSKMEGTGMYTYSQFYEVSEDRKSLNRVKWEPEVGESEPDIGVETVDAYYDAASDTYFYIFDDVIRAGFGESMDTVMSLCLVKGEIKTETIASQHQLVGEDGESVETTYKLADGTFITSDEYYSSDENRFRDAKPLFASISWFSYMADAEIDFATELRVSWEGFSIAEE